MAISIYSGTETSTTMLTIPSFRRGHLFVLTTFCDEDIGRWMLSFGSGRRRIHSPDILHLAPSEVAWVSPRWCVLSSVQDHAARNAARSPKG